MGTVVLSRAKVFQAKVVCWWKTVDPQEADCDRGGVVSVEVVLEEQLQ
jgi:hypothetical protein